MAKDTESARVQAEEVRANREYRSRLDDALARLLHAIADYFGPLRQWLSAENEAIAGNWHDQNGDLLTPETPGMDQIETQAQVVRMIAVGEDAEVAKRVAWALAAINNLKPSLRTNALKGLVLMVQQWRSGELSLETTLEWLIAFEETHQYRVNYGE